MARWRDLVRALGHDFLWSGNHGVELRSRARQSMQCALYSTVFKSSAITCQTYRNDFKLTSSSWDMPFTSREDLCRTCSVVGQGMRSGLGS